jgi:hypothetical protein
MNSIPFPPLLKIKIQKKDILERHVRPSIKICSLGFLMFMVFP